MGEQRRDAGADRKPRRGRVARALAAAALAGSVGALLLASGATAHPAAGPTTARGVAGGARGADQPLAFGDARTFALSAPAAASGAPAVAMAVTPDGRGYWTVSALGQVSGFGDARSFGSATRLRGAQVTGMAVAAGGRGYWLVTDRGTVLAFGRARAYGSARPRAGDHVVAIAAAPGGGGYWIASADGRVWGFGDARPLGSPGGGVEDIVALAAAPRGPGYWLVSARGGVLPYGSARFHGSALGPRAAGGVAGIAPTADGGGYWLVTAGGGVAAFGDAAAHGTAVAASAPAVVAIAATADGRGYWILRSRQAPPEPPLSGRAPGHVTAIGDSVMLDAAPDLEADIPGIDIEAAVSRQWDDGIALARELARQHRLGPIVVIDLGSNGPITWQQFMNMMSALAGIWRVVFVTVHPPPSTGWGPAVNTVLAAGAARYPQVRIADFNALADQHPAWFGSDGVHMAVGGPGAQALAALIRSQL